MSVNDLRIGILEGTITKDTELKHSETTHKPYVQFCIASNKSIKKNGNYEKDTVFFDLFIEEKFSFEIKKVIFLPYIIRFYTFFYDNPNFSQKHKNKYFKNI